MSCLDLKCELTPDCNIKFKLSTDYTGTDVSGNIIEAIATSSHKLELCSGLVKFTNLECANLKKLILGVPLVFVKNCHLYRLNLPDITGDVFNNTAYASNIVVKCIDDDSAMNIGLQVANGYLYVIIDVEGKIVTIGEGAPSLEFCIELFCFDVTKKFIPCGCELKCKPITWSYGYESIV